MSELNRPFVGSRPVLVTGASSGIGRKITEELTSLGHHVYAGVRKQTDLKSLNEMKNVTALQLDVTNAKNISDAVDYINSAGRGLYGLVNNAGIATVGRVSEISEEEFQLTMAVNAFAPYFVTRAFLPLIASAKGRIVMMGSIAGILAERELSAYSMSKHALEALTDVLSAELGELNVKVSIIEPGVFNTNLVRNAAQRIRASQSLPDLSRYERPDAVASAACAALFSHTPKRRYLVVTRRDEAQKTISKQMERLPQLNDGHRFSLNRSQLVSLLDQFFSRIESEPPDMPTRDELYSP